ncbi:GTP-binding protein [Pseudomonas sp. OIL-1]|uniref:CobW family GTP-binding protein n=1 Tax=Pseudomonas sp. OIL-1 TaxID=2706126 RepID=UPI0013A70EEE|nr:GTP-binding protein [Pseudomonas sp. OIL-1]QIB50482.1 GTP-binding protein [Pseudomonas sp. OIL-1]
MLEQIPTHLIAGPLGSGKTTLIRHLISERPDGERWAILINEFGEVGIDAALLQNDDDGVSLAEVPGGCLCCVNGLPFQVGLSRLLRRTRPDRLFIEASGLGHPSTLLAQLRGFPWKDVLALQPMLMVLDAQALHTGRELVDAQRSALSQAGLLILNKSAALGMADRKAILSRLQTIAPVYWCQHSQLPWENVPRQTEPLSIAPGLDDLPDAPAGPATLWRSVDDWHCRQSSRDVWYSIGWQIHPAQQFKREALEDWLSRSDWQRAKGVAHTEDGWMSFNGTGEKSLNWQPSPWRSDNRIELLMTQRPDSHQLESGLQAARRNQ